MAVEYLTRFTNFDDEDSGDIVLDDDDPEKEEKEGEVEEETDGEKIDEEEE